MNQKTGKWGILTCIIGNPPLIFPKMSLIIHLTEKSPFILFLSLATQLRILFHPNMFYTVFACLIAF